MKQQQPLRIVISNSGRTLLKVPNGEMPISVYRELKRLSTQTATARA